MTVDGTSSPTQDPPRTELRATVEASELLLFSRDLRGTTTDVVVAATGRALAAHPVFAGADAAPAIGVTIESAGGLVVPVVRGAGQAPLPAIRDEVERVTRAALDGRLTADDLGAAAVIVHDPFPGAGASAPVGLGGRVLRVDRGACDSPELTLTLTAEGSGAAGEEAALFFATLVRLLRHPYRRLV